MANETIGPKIKQFRKDNNLTQEQLAEALGYSGKSVISHIEKGDADMTYEKMVLFLNKFKIDANELFGIANPNPKVKEEVAPQKVKRVAVYIHGLKGSSKEANDYKFLKGQYDVVGLDYEDGNPWELKETIQKEFKKLIKGYQEVIVIANSIGAFYACEYLSDFKIKQAFFISPIVSMLQTIVDLMNLYEIKDRDLKRKKFIKLDNGTMLSYDFYQHVSTEDDHWKVPTEILYGAYDQEIYILSVTEFLENHPLCRLTIKNESEHFFESQEEKLFIKNWIKRLLKK